MTEKIEIQPPTVFCSLLLLEKSGSIVRMLERLKHARELHQWTSNNNDCFLRKPRNEDRASRG